MLSAITGFVQTYPIFFETAGLIAAILLGTWFLRWLGGVTVRPLAEALVKEIDANLRVTGFGKGDEADAILTIKFLNINTRAEHHLKMVTALGEYTFMQVIMLLMTSGVAALALFVLSRDGWKGGDTQLLVLFAITAAAAAIYAAIGRIFRVSDNFRANALAYTQLLQLGDQIRTYAFTRSADGAKTLTTFLEAVDKSLGAYRTIAFNFDLSQAPTVSALVTDLVAASKRPEIPEIPDSGSESGRESGKAARVTHRAFGDGDQDKAPGQTAERSTVVQIDGAKPDASAMSVAAGTNGTSVEQQPPPAATKTDLP